MTDSSLVRKKKKITYTACTQGIERAENALKRLGFKSKSNFAESQYLSRSTVTKFFQCQPIQLDSFKRICKALKLNWAEVAGIIEEGQLECLEINSSSSSESMSEKSVKSDELISETQPAFSRSLTDSQRQHLKQRQDTLQAEWQLRSEKLNKLRLDYAIEVGTAIKFQLQQQIQSEETQLSHLERDLNEIEQNISLGAGFSPFQTFSDTDVQAVHRQVSVLDKQSKKIKAVITLEGDINSVNNDLSVTLELFLRTYSGDTIKITDIKAGSIRLIVEGSQEDIERLVSRIQSGEITELSGFPVEDIQVLNETSDDEESDELNDKWHLVQEIVNHPVKGRNLRNADLSDADLSDADLIGADLIGADLSSADLSDADLRDANLSRANLIGANLIGAYLSDAYLGGAYLSDAYLGRAILGGANLIDANLSDAYLGGANLSGANLIDANLIGANLIDANLSRTKLTRASLSRANLIDANLSGASLSRADLIGANLSDANLSHANLSDAYLIFADLSGANLSDADLRGANLIGANLSGANLSRANVENARFGNNRGISEARKRDLIQKGAIFEDSHGDRSSILLPH